MSNLGWLSLSEALDVLAPTKEERKVAAERVLSALTTGQMIATALDADGDRVEIAADDWTRGTPNWRESLLVINPRSITPLSLAHDGVMNRPNLNPRAVNYGAVDVHGRPRIVSVGHSPPERRYFSIRLPRPGVEDLLPQRSSGPRAAGGRPPEYDWPKMRDFALDLMRKHGAPSPTNRKLPTKNDLIEAVIDFYQQAHGRDPAKSSVKPRADQWIADFMEESETGS